MERARWSAARVRGGLRIGAGGGRRRHANAVPAVAVQLVLLVRRRPDRLRVLGRSAAAWIPGRVGRRAGPGGSRRSVRPPHHQEPVGAGHLHAAGPIRGLPQHQRRCRDQSGVDGLRRPDAGLGDAVERPPVGVRRGRRGCDEPVRFRDRRRDRAGERALCRRPARRRARVSCDAEGRHPLRRHLFARPQVAQPAVDPALHDRDSLPHAAAARGDGRRPTGGRDSRFPEASFDWVTRPTC